MTVAYGDVPLIDPVTGRFPDAFAPPSVAAAVTSTAEDAAAAEAARAAAEALTDVTVTSGAVVGNDLILTRTDATTVNAGNVRGATGPANALTIGTVTTLPAGSSATASIGGTAPTQTLSLGLPNGQPSDWLKVGPGDPRTPASTGGAITGAEPNGCMYRSTDGGGVGGFGWAKRAGVWVCEVLDTGTRNIASLLDTTNWEINPTAGFLHLSRVNGEVHIAGRLRRLTTGARFSHFLPLALPVGFRHPSPHFVPIASSANSLSYIGVLSFESTLERPVLMFPLGTPEWAVGDAVGFSGTYSVGSAPAPTTLPGTAV